MDRREARTRQIEGDAAFGRVDVEEAPRTLVAVLRITSVPGGAAGYYGVLAVDVSGTETEGGAVSLATTGIGFFAANVGTSAPAIGTDVIARMVSAGRWVFRFG